LKFDKSQPKKIKFADEEEKPDPPKPGDTGEIKELKIIYTKTGQIIRSKDRDEIHADPTVAKAKENMLTVKKAQETFKDSVY